MINDEERGGGRERELIIHSLGSLVDGSHCHNSARMTEFRINLERKSVWWEEEAGTYIVEIVERVKDLVFGQICVKM